MSTDAKFVRMDWKG